MPISHLYFLLLVDDEQAFIEVIARRLRQRGYEVKCVFSGQAALNRLEGGGGIIDVVVLDVQMPGLDGIQTVKQIRQRKLLPLRKPAFESEKL